MGMLSTDEINNLRLSPASLALTSYGHWVPLSLLFVSIREAIVEDAISYERKEAAFKAMADLVLACLPQGTEPLFKLDGGK